MSQWQPNPEELHQLLRLLENSQSTDQAIQHENTRELQRIGQFPQFLIYCCYIFVNLKDQQEFIRVVAGLLLKNNLPGNVKNLTPDVKSYIKHQIASVLGDPTPAIRNTAGTIVSVLAKQEPWPGLVELLADGLNQPDESIVNGVLDTVYKICEDSIHVLDVEDADGKRPLNVLVPKILSLFKSDKLNLRLQAIKILNLFILPAPHAFLIHLEEFLQGIFYLSNDQPSVRQYVCQAFVLLIEARMDCVIPSMQNIIKYMIHSMKDTDLLIVVESCEFFTSLADTKDFCRKELKPFLPELMPLLLTRMEFSDDEVESLLDKDDANIPDVSIAPKFTKGRTKGSQTRQGSDDENPSDQGDWNIRKSAAIGMDLLSSVFMEEFLPPLFSHIEERLKSNNWIHRESAILALGAIAVGCCDGLDPLLPNLMSFLITQLEHERPLIRAITCWTICRYADWVVSQPEIDRYLQPLIEKLLPRALDGSKRVQAAACSALATYQETSVKYITPYIDRILPVYAQALFRYQANNLSILYDAIGTLAEAVGTVLSNPDLYNIIFPPVLMQWNSTPDDNPRLNLLSDCLSSLCLSMGSQTQTFAIPIFSRCVRIIEVWIVQIAEHLRDTQNNPAPDKDTLIASMDLLSSLCEALGTSIESLVQKTPSLPLLILEVSKFSGPDSHDIRQSCFALIGDLSKHSFVHIQGQILSLIPILVENVTVSDSYSISVANNAIWALGEISFKIGAAIRPYVPTLLTRLVPYLSDTTIEKSLRKNSAITIGRLGLACPQDVSQHISKFCQPLCLSLRMIRDDFEKETAFKGLCAVIRENPSAVEDSLFFVLDAFASWWEPSLELQQIFHSIIHGFKSKISSETWNFIFFQLPQDVQEVLQNTYRV